MRSYKFIIIGATIFVVIACSPMVKTKKVAEGRYELTVSNYHCDLDNGNDDCFCTYKNDSTDLINETDTCIKCGQIFSNHETRGEYYQRDAVDKYMIY